MYRHIAVAALVVLAACADDTISAPATASPAPRIAAQYDTARGVIAARVSDDAGDGVYFLTLAGDSLRLVGPLADILAGMAGTELWVGGHLGVDNMMEVEVYAFRGPDLGADCQDPNNRVINDDGRCRLRETGIRPRERATWKR